MKAILNSQENRFQTYLMNKHSFVLHTKMVLFVLVLFLSIVEILFAQQLILDLGPEEEILAEKFSPVLHKHPDDRQAGLADFNDIILNHATLKAWNIIGQELYNASTPPIHVYNQGQWCSFGNGTTWAYWKLDIDNNVRYEGAPPGDRPLYYHAYKDGNYFYLQYWYFFTMNDLTGQTSSNT